MAFPEETEKAKNNRVNLKSGYLPSLKKSETLSFSTISSLNE